jgi:hypothetical protein
MGVSDNINEDGKIRRNWNRYAEGKTVKDLLFFLEHAGIDRTKYQNGKAVSSKSLMNKVGKLEPLKDEFYSYFIVSSLALIDPNLNISDEEIDSMNEIFATYNKKKMLFTRRESLDLAEGEIGMKMNEVFGVDRAPHFSAYTLHILKPFKEQYAELEI